MMLLLSVTIGVVLVVPALTHAQDKTSAIDKIFSWVAPGMPGCAVAASQHGKLVVNRVYGVADLERDVPMSPATLFDAASIRKQFVAAAVFLLVEQGRLALSDDVRKHVPELPDYGRTITLDHLLMHTSGLRDWIPLQDWGNGSDEAMTLICASAPSISRRVRNGPTRTAAMCCSRRPSRARAGCRSPNSRASVCSIHWA